MAARLDADLEDVLETRNQERLNMTHLTAANAVIAVCEAPGRWCWNFS